MMAKDYECMMNAEGIQSIKTEKLKRRKQKKQEVQERDPPLHTHIQNGEKEIQPEGKHDRGAD